MTVIHKVRITKVEVPVRSTGETIKVWEISCTCAQTFRRPTWPRALAKAWSHLDDGVILLDLR